MFVTFEESDNIGISVLKVSSSLFNTKTLSTETCFYAFAQYSLKKTFSSKMYQKLVSSKFAKI